MTHTTFIVLVQETIVFSMKIKGKFNLKTYFMLDFVLIGFHEVGKRIKWETK